jgi:hypothetical protein
MACSIPVIESIETIIPQEITNLRDIFVSKTTYYVDRLHAALEEVLEVSRLSLGSSDLTLELGLGVFQSSDSGLVEVLNISY